MSRTSTGSRGNQGHNFSEIASAEIPRSTFNRSSTLKTTFDGNYLIPIFNDEILPGDTINLRQRSFIRLQTPTVATMEEISVEVQYFFIPLRLIWDDYGPFMGVQENADDSIDFTVPQMTSAGGSTTQDSLSARLGVPIQATNCTHSALFHRAYALCYNDWYRDPNLQDKITVDTDAGPDTEGDYLIQTRGKTKDLFTGALPWPQRGDPINLVFDGIVPVVLTSGVITGTGAPTFDGSTSGGSDPLESTGGGLTEVKIDGVAGDLEWSNTALLLDDLTGTADLSTASVNTINGLRSAFSVQRLLERDARGGARLPEILKSHFRVTSPDARLQRVEYLGGTSTTININPVAATTDNSGANIGDVAGTGVGIGHGNSIMYSATEHGIIMGIASARAPISYQQGLARKFTRFTRYDFFWPAFSHLGEQPIHTGELFATGTADRAAGTGDFAVFAYNEAWSQYRYRQNEIGGEFLSETATPLDVWHLAYDFASLPTLDDSFIKSATPFHRIVAVPGAVHFLADFAFDIKHTRPLPTFSTPGLIDHF